MCEEHFCVTPPVTFAEHIGKFPGSDVSTEHWNWLFGSTEDGSAKNEEPDASEEAIAPEPDSVRKDDWEAVCGESPDDVASPALGIADHAKAATAASVLSLGRCVRCCMAD